MKTALIALCVLACCPCFGDEEAQVEKGARFRLVAMHRDQYLIDTKTGQIWQPVCIYSSYSENKTKCVTTIWKKMAVQDITANLASISEDIDKRDRKENGFNPDAYLKSKAATPPRDQP